MRCLSPGSRSGSQRFRTPIFGQRPRIFTATNRLVSECALTSKNHSPVIGWRGKISSTDHLFERHQPANRSTAPPQPGIQAQPTDAFPYIFGKTGVSTRDNFVDHRSHPVQAPVYPPPEFRSNRLHTQLNPAMVIKITGSTAPVSSIARTPMCHFLLRGFTIQTSAATSIIEPKMPALLQCRSGAPPGLTAMTDARRAEGGRPRSGTRTQTLANAKWACSISPFP